MLAKIFFFFAHADRREGPYVKYDIRQGKERREKENKKKKKDLLDIKEERERKEKKTVVYSIQL